MARFCRFCGSPVNTTAKFCPTCGKSLAREDVPADSNANPPLASTLARAFTVMAPQAEGEMLLGEVNASDDAFAGVMKAVQSASAGSASIGKAVSGARASLPKADSDDIPSFGKSLSSAFKSLGTGFKEAFTGKNKKALVFAIVMALVWMFQLMIIMLGGSGPIGKVFEWLTFARGGYSVNPLLVVGGTLGKAVVAAGFFTIINGGGASVVEGAKSILARSNFKKTTIGPFLVAAGIALCLYQVFAGYAALNDTMAAIAGAVLACKAAGSKAGGVFAIARALTAGKRSDGSRFERPESVSAVLAGASAGFALGVPTSVVPFSWAPAVTGAVLLVAGIALTLIGRGGGQKAAAVSLSLAMLSVMCAPYAALSAQADEGGEDPRSGEIYRVLDGRQDPYSKARINYEVSGGTDFTFGWDSNWARWNGNVIAKPGETVTVSYQTSGFTTIDEYNESIQFYHTANEYDWRYRNWEQVYYYHDDMSEQVFLRNQDEMLSGSSPSASGTVSFTVPSYEELKDMDVRFERIHGYYVFTFSIGESVTATRTSNPNDKLGVSLSFTIDVYVDRPQDASVTVAADKNAGDMGVDIPEVVIRDVLSVAAAAAGVAGVAGAAGATGAAGAVGTAGAAGAQGNGRKEEDRVVGMRLYATKSFGDGIRKGAQPVEVQARVVLVLKSGKERLAFGEANNIDVTAKSLNVRSQVGPHGAFISAFVSADAHEKSDKGTLTFAYTSSATLFYNIEFKLVGLPTIEFPDARPIGSDACLDMVAGDGCTYATRIVFKDAIGAPTQLKLHTPDDVRATTRETDDPCTMYALVGNDLAPIDYTVATQFPRRMIRVSAKFENGDAVEGKLLVRLYPEGLSVESENVFDERLVVATAALPNDAPENLKPTDFEVHAVYCDPVVASMKVNMRGDVPANLTEAILVPPDLAGVHFGDLDSVGAYGEVFKTNFDYDIPLVRGPSGWDSFRFDPKNALPMPDDPYTMDVRISCLYNGRAMQLGLPLSITGDNPNVPGEWKLEVDKLRKTVGYFGVSSSGFARSFIQNIRYRTPNDISMFRYEIIREARDYYERDAAALLGNGKTLAICENGATFLKWIGDVSFSYLITVYGGGPLVESFASPLKGMYEDFVGEYLVAWSDGQEFKFDGSSALLKSINQGVENTISNMLSGSIENPYKVGYVVAAFIMTSFVRHYNFGEDGEKGDIFKSLLSATGDLGGVYLRSYAGKVFGDYLKKLQSQASAASGKALNKLEKMIVDYFEKRAGVSLDFSYPDAVQKWIEETCGFVGTKVYEATVGNVDGVIDYKGDSSSGYLHLGLFGYRVAIPLGDNALQCATVFYEQTLKMYDDNARNITVDDYMRLKKYQA